MRLLNTILLFLFLCPLCSCEQISSLFGRKSNGDSLFQEIQGIYPAYNKKELETFCSYFSEDVNVFKEQGLGNTRIISGKQDFKSYYERVFNTKKNLKVTPLMHFTVYPWIMVKELIENEEQVFEAAVGYRLQNGKIRDRMILSENFLVNKKNIGVDLPKQKPTLLPPPHAPINN